LVILCCLGLGRLLRKINGLEFPVFGGQDLLLFLAEDLLGDMISDCGTLTTLPPAGFRLGSCTAVGAWIQPSVFPGDEFERSELLSSS